MGTAFASDGYVWADVDTFFSQDYNGQVGSSCCKERFRMLIDLLDNRGLSPQERNATWQRTDGDSFETSLSAQVEPVHVAGVLPSGRTT